MDYNNPKLTIKELKDECKRLKLKVFGTRVMLVARLTAHAEKTENGTLKPKAGPKGKGKGKAVKEDDDDDDDDEEVKPKAPAKGKRKREEQEDENEDEAEEAPKTKARPPAAKKAKVSIKVDDAVVHLPGAEVVDDWGVMLNQTDIGNNNNKFYVIQVIKSGGGFYCHTRWGRVGEPGQSATKDFPNQAAAEKEFAKKFRDKTKNDWASVRVSAANFTKQPGLYSLVEIDHDSKVDHEALEAALTGVKAKGAAAVAEKNTKVAPTKLPTETQELIKIIFDEDMFQDQLKELEIDVKQLPLGKLNKNQIQKGFDALEKLKTAMKAKNKQGMNDFSNEFYTLIPHSFKRQRPPVITDEETLQTKMDMLNVLNDIEIAQTLTTEKIFEVTRNGEDARFKAHDKLGNRKLLWHGTNVAVVVAILNTGLRIMPHSGGRVGKGIYFASESGKSAGYVTRNAKGTGFMFLNEVALGNEHHITSDDSSLKAPPKGFDCVIAQGATEPDHSKAETVKLNGKDVVMAMGKPQSRSQYKNSTFSQSEYLVYQENQVRIRYLLKLKYPSGGYW